MTEPERVLFERMVAHHVPYVLVRLATATCFGPPYDDHLRAMFGEDNTQVEGVAGQWVLFLGTFKDYGYVLGPADDWAGILAQALELIDAGEVAQVTMSKEELGIVPEPEKAKPIPAALRAPVKKMAWGTLW